jgi:hypothetical protein
MIFESFIVGLKMKSLICPWFRIWRYDNTYAITCLSSSNYQIEFHQLLFIIKLYKSWSNMTEDDEIVFDPREKKKKSKPKPDIVDEQPLVCIYLLFPICIFYRAILKRRYSIRAVKRRRRKK